MLHSNRLVMIEMKSEQKTAYVESVNVKISEMVGKQARRMCDCCELPTNCAAVKDYETAMYGAQFFPNGLHPIIVWVCADCQTHDESCAEAERINAEIDNERQRDLSWSEYCEVSA